MSRLASLRLFRLFALAALMALGAASQLSGSITTYAAGTTYTVLVGGGQGGVSVETFRPNLIMISPGDSVKFTNPYEEIHTVTFPAGATSGLDFVVPVPQLKGPPKITLNGKTAMPTTATSFDGSAFAGSGVLNKGENWTLTFPKSGSYDFLCVVHPGMTGTVQVLQPGNYVPAQSQIDADARASLTRDVAKGDASAAKAAPSKTANTNGTTTWQVVNAASAGQSDVMRFIPSRLQVGVGDTVTWTNPTMVPHTVTFLSGSPEPDFVTPEFGPGGPSAGPPTLVIPANVVFAVKPSPNYDGTGYVNSGFIGAGPEATGGTTFSLTFTKPGAYTYLCLLHDDQGMAGVVQVGAASGVTLTPPATGDAGLASRDTATWPLALLAGVLGVGALAAIRLRSRA